jgi:HNH endonuclease
MEAKPIDIHDLRFEEKDAEIFKIADTKTRLDTLQNYFFPRLEVLLHDTLALIQNIYGVSPYERMTETSQPRHRQNAQQNLDSGEVQIGLTGKRRTDRFLITQRADGTPFSYHSCDLTYIVEPFASLHVSLGPFRQNVDSQYISTIRGLIRKHAKELSPMLALYHVAHNCVSEGAFVDLSEAFGPGAVSNAMPTWLLALESPRYCFPVDDRTFPVLEGAFAVLYPLLEACIAIAEGEPHQLSERLKTFKRWYVEAIKRDEAALDGESDPLAEPEPDLPELNSYAIIRPGIWWAVLARDNWTCGSCGRSTRQDGVLLEVDHILPRSRGGTDALDNLQTLCKKCNVGKSNRDNTNLRRSQR